MIIAQELDEKYMRLALKEARKAEERGEVPVGAILVKGDKVLSRDHNRCIQLNDPAAHAEVLVLRKAGKVLNNYRLNDTVMYVTAEPCPMCAAAMVHSRISKLVFGTLESKFGAVESRFKLFQDRSVNHRVEVTGGVLEKECAEVLKNFFRERRAAHKKVRSIKNQG
jgi:tRNA(adenine34) deaminase